MAPDIRKLKSYVWHGDKCFFISTIERDSSACVQPPPPRYHETIVWEYDWETRERGEIVGMDGEGVAFDQHYRMCKSIYETGEATHEDH